MEVEDAIRTRRTHKVFGAEPIPDDVLRELVEIATWAPNHHLTNPWRFRVLGPEARAALQAVSQPRFTNKPIESNTLLQAPTTISVSAARSGDPVVQKENVLATGAAVYALLLAAHDRGYAGYWRSPTLLHTDAGLAAVGIGRDEEFVALVSLGPLRQEAKAPERVPVDEVLSYLG